MIAPTHPSRRRTAREPTPGVDRPDRAWPAIALVGVSAATPSAKSSKTKTFKFVFSFSDADVRLDLGAAGVDDRRHARPSPGRSRTTAQTSRVGFAQGHCVITLPNRPLAQCTSSLFFDHGQIATQGPNYFNRPFNHAITGGTGVFRDAAGEMRAEPLPGNDRAGRSR